MNKSNKTSYSNILKSTSLFGFLQLIKMVISVVSQKLVAVFLGASGVGLVAYLNNIINILLSFTNFEFQKIATREVALVSEHEEAQQKKINLLQNIAVYIGFFGALISILFAPLLCELTFGSTKYVSWFYFLAIYFVVFTFSNLKMAMLIASNNIKKIAICNIFIAIISALGTILIYYFLRTEGIVWVIIYNVLAVYIITSFYTKNYSFKFIHFNQFISESSPVFKMGFMLSVNLIFGQICNFTIKYFLKNYTNSTEILGFYEVSNIILINYLGLIFNTITMDFYPKITALKDDLKTINRLVNNQVEIAIIIVTPAIVFMFLFGKMIIELLYTKEFLPTFLILKFALFSVIIKTICFPMAYIILAKGNKKQYFVQELFSDFMNISFTIVGYYFFGLPGIGFAIVLNYVVYAIYIYRVVRQKYNIAFDNQCSRLISINVIIGIIAIVFIFIEDIFVSNLLLSILLLSSLIYSFIELNKRILIIDFIKNKLK